MAKTISQRQLRNDNARVVDAVVAGETFVVTRNGTPVAELRPLRQPRSRFVGRAAIAEAMASGPHIDAAAFRADSDAVIDGALLPGTHEVEPTVDGRP